uniref:Uncharacterized protein n=1 Tax=Arundo donax TaxID=35708 RepID=A0A0A9E0C0_ARUDO
MLGCPCSSSREKIESLVFLKTTPSKVEEQSDDSFG